MLVFPQNGPGALLFRLRSLPSSLFLLLLCFLSAPGGVHATLRNRTIDDTIGDVVTLTRPIFRPETLGVWEGNTCKTCSIQPDRLLAYNETWTAATYNPDLESISVELQFTGVAIYVFFILANDQGDGITTKTIADFFMDGQFVESFEHTPTASTELEYDALVFSQEFLSNTTHNLTMVTRDINETIYVNFDYAFYTFDDGPGSNNTIAPPPAPTSTAPASAAPPSQVGVIAGAVVGGLVGLIATALSIFFFVRLRRQRTGKVDPIEAPLDMSFLSPTNANISASAPFFSNSTATSEVSQGAYPYNIPPYAAAAQTSVSSRLNEKFGYGYQEYNNTTTSLANPGTPTDIRSGAYPSSAHNHTAYPPAVPAPIDVGSSSSSPSSGVPHYKTAVQRPAGKNVFSSLPSGQIVLSTGRSRVGLAEGSEDDDGILASVQQYQQQQQQQLRTAASLQNINMAISSPPANPAPPGKVTSTITFSQNAANASAAAYLTTANATADQLRRARQEELNLQMERIQQEMGALNREAGRRTTVKRGVNGAGAGVGAGSGAVGGDVMRRVRTNEGPVDMDEEREVAALRKQITILRDQVETLQDSRESPWAQGLSDDPPPGYTPQLSPPPRRPLPPPV